MLASNTVLAFYSFPCVLLQHCVLNKSTGKGGVSGREEASSEEGVKAAGNSAQGHQGAGAHGSRVGLCL